ncbi:MAG: TonB-dependent receptor plug domain-containing protein [Saprospiraceae bacterium]|nr:TonB-dependent receptor plug domain-containing protein [Saprospiraceae bacterium]
MKSLLTVFFAFVITHIWGQNATGYIFDEAKKPLETAYVLNQKTNSHAHTNEAGFFNINQTSVGDTLKIVLLGYKSQYFIVKNAEKSTIILPKSIFELDEITINASPKTQNIVSDIDVRINPVNSSQEILRKVPGLFIGQHAGGGKAEQIFLRGFDIDHGTDINITVDGMPVNMVSHAHGQGYADLHFLIPETVGKLDFGKGSYYADKGNLTTAGYVAFSTKDKLDNSAVSIEAGQFNTFRTVGLFKLLSGENNQNAYIATEYLATNGAFESPQNFNRLNVMGKYSTILPNQDKIIISASHFKSRWDASGQVPQRAVESRLISRFGAIDNTEGGQTSRSNINFQFNKRIDNQSFVKTTAYLSQYNFELFSNFTFFLNDSINGDQIKQKEKRNIYGLHSEWNKTVNFGKGELDLQIGGGFRTDDNRDVELSHTVNRKTLIEAIKLGDITETNTFGYANAEFNFGKWLINPAVRFDNFSFIYNDQLATKYATQSIKKSILSPKLNFAYNASRNLQYYLKMGKGFHSNDTRVVVAQTGNEILPAAYSADLGLMWKPQPRLLLNVALWHLYLEQEFVYVGDEGVVEPSGRTRRQGVDMGLRYQMTEGVFFNGDVNYTIARSIDDEKGQNYIPLAPDLTAVGGLTVQKGRWAGSYQFRYLKSRPANEDNSIVAKGYFVNDANVNYQWRNMNLGISVENLFNTAWNETQFATESRLKNEPQSVEEIHFIPGTPFFLKGKMTIQF